MSQTTINLRTKNRQSTLMLSGFISTLLGVVVNMWWTGRAEGVNSLTLWMGCREVPTHHNNQLFIWL